MKDENIFDQKAAEWDDNPRRREMSERFAGEIEKHVSLQQAKTVAMELGCGTGSVSMHLYSSLKFVKMVDTSKGMLDVVQQKMDYYNIHNMSLHQGEVTELNFEKDSFDLIYSLMTLHHVKDIDSLFESLYRLMNKGGKLCIGDLETEDGSFHHGEHTDIHFGFDTGSLKNHLEKKGFVVKDIVRMNVLKKEDSEGNMREYPQFFMLVEKV